MRVSSGGRVYPPMRVYNIGVNFPILTITAMKIYLCLYWRSDS